MKKARTFLIPVAGFIASFSLLQAQYSNTMFFMKGVPQAHFLNPAYQPACNVYFGFPAFSTMQVSVENDALAPHDIFFYNPLIDSTITFLHPSADKEKFLSNFSSRNFVNSDVSIDMVSFGFRAGKMFFSFDVSEKGFVRFTYPKDLPSLPVYFSLDASGNPGNFDLSALNIYSSFYSELACGISRSFLDDKLKIGVRGKILLGQGNIHTLNNNITVHTSFENNWTIVSDFTANGSIPFSEIPRDSTGKFDFGNISFNKPKTSDYLDVFLRKPNPGLAMDFGVEYRPIPLVTLSASILDLGYIRWKNNTYNIVQNTTYEFRGVEMTNFITGEDTSDFGQTLLDTLKDAFTFSSLNRAYTSRLPFHMMVGGAVNLSKGISLGIMDHIEMWQSRMYNELVLSANLSAGKFFSTSLSYSILNIEYHDIGAGFAFKPGPFHLFLIFDHIPVMYDKEVNYKVPVPMYVKAFNFRMGMNLIFGCNKKKSVMRDIPLVD